MSKKIIISIIILIMVAGLVWFFLPKEQYTGPMCDGCSWTPCKCFGFEKIKSIEEPYTVCHGITYNCPTEGVDY